MSKPRLQLLTAILILLLCSPLMAVQLRSGHPNEVIVAKGDTLWDISGRFLQHPWEWPKLWKRNPSIKNPDLIYPGDRLRLTWVNGQPRLVRQGGRKRGSPLGIISLRELRAFLSRPYLLDDRVIENSGYIVGFREGTLIAGSGERAYARHLGSVEDNFDIVRPGNLYEDYETGEVLGRVALFVGTAKLLRDGDPATIRITSTAMEVKQGDRLIPSTAKRVKNLYFHPGVPNQTVGGHIIDVPGGVNIAGQYSVVAIDRGAADGIGQGDVLLVNTNQRHVVDRFAPRESDESYYPENRNMWGEAIVTLPEESAGKVIIFRVFDRVSFGLISSATRSIKSGYPVYSP
ncbi:MAG TPA: peptidoglycan-binding protein [Gammaproteobacteria bacterium]|nr:peptidoglycan-binding protein [Gammaproteobacteria bacterium]